MVSETGKVVRRGTYPEVYALLWVTRDCESRIADFLRSRGIPKDAIHRGQHLTVYYARRNLPALSRRIRRRVSISADVAETRFMVLAPGGENPRPEYEPATRSVAIRLTRRNRAVPEIQALRTEMRRFETPDVVGTRKPSTAWTNCFGARHYQPHIKLLKPGSEIGRDLTLIGDEFRRSFETIAFGKYEIVTRQKLRRREHSGNERSARSEG